MADGHNEGHTPERYEDTTDPRNPPNSVVNREVRGTALRSYLLPLIALFLVAGLGLIYWANRSPVMNDDPSEVGTTGDRQDVVGERGNRTDTPGGFDPQPQPDSTADELERRGVNEPLRAPSSGVSAAAPLNELGAMLEDDPRTVLGRRIDVQDVDVVEARDATTFWIQDGDARALVSAPPGGPGVRDGSRVSVSGVVEPDGQGGVRIRATRVSVQ